MVHRWSLAACLLLLQATLLGWQVTAQQASAFLPSGLPALAEGVTARLVYRMNGFAENFKDPTVRAVYLADRVVLEPTFWRDQFADTGGVATLGPTRAAGNNFTVTSGNTSSETSRPELNFSGMPNAIMVDNGGYLLFNNVLISDISDVYHYSYTPYQPYINRGIGYALWPSIALAPGALVHLWNVSVAYINPSKLDNCEQYNRKALFGLQQAYGTGNVTQVNATAGRIGGPVNITVVVSNGSTDASVGNATAIYDNVTFNCLEARPTPPPASSGLSPGALAAAIAVPIVVALAACFLACCCIRRRNMRRRRAVAAEDARNKDLEAGGLRMQPSTDLANMRDQYDPPPGRNLRASGGSASPSIGTGSSASTLRNFLAISPDTPFMEGLLGTRTSMHSTGGSSGSSMQRMRAAAAAAAAGSSGASVLTPVGSMPLPMHPSSSQSQNPSNGSDGRWGCTPSTQSSTMQRLSIDTHIAAIGTASSTAGTESSSMGPLHTGGTLATSSGAGTGGRSSGGAGSSGGRPTVAERYAGITSLLKARSDIAVLRELKIGLLLGRGSYGRVYRGRWKATTVAVKIIEHVEGAPGTASSGGKRISVGRESLLATNISHPNVVQTYHISTLTVAQRSALANTWLTEGVGGGTAGSPVQTDNLQQPDDNSSDDNNSHGSMEAPKDLLETWMIMEFCEKGSLERAVNQGRFIRRADKHPELVGIYKALLDTASGLEYLHSIGVVHGDLKTANVLLKGSAKDPRGFKCLITDFGLSRVLDLDATHISTATYGTIVYMPKELLLSGRMTQATDIYSFGLMMWELLTSSRVFDEGLSIGQMFYMIAYQNWRPQIPDNCPPGFAELMTACWHEDPTERPTAQQLLKRLQRLYAQAKQDLAASRAAEAAVAGAGAAAAAAVLGGPSSSDSAKSGGAAAVPEGQGTGRTKHKAAPKAAAAAAAGASSYPGSDSSMVSSAVGHLSPGASDSQPQGSGGSAGPQEDAISSGGEVEGYKPYAAAALQRKRSGSLATGSASGLSQAGHSSAGRKQSQQQPVVPAAGKVIYKSAVGNASGGTLPGSSEIEVFDDPIPSESLLQNFTDSSNIHDGDEPQDDADESSGYLAEDSSSGRPGRGAAGASADVGSLEMTTRAAGRGAAAGTSRGGFWGGSAAPDGPGTRSDDGSYSYRDSFSTGTMPSVVADSWIGSQASRSFAGSSQPSGRFTSSMTLGSLPPHSPTYASGASAGAAPPAGVGPYAAEDEGGSSGPQPGLVSAFQAAAGMPPASAASRSYGTLQTVHEGSGPLDAGANSPTVSPGGTTADARAAMAQGDAGGQAAGDAAAARAPTASPFAALAQRAGSLFGPLK